MGRRQITSLHFAVRPRVLLKYGGQLLLLFSALTSIPFMVSLVAGDFRMSLVYGGILAGTGLAGFLLQRLEAPGNLQNNEVLTLTAVMFIITPLIAAIAFRQSGLGFDEALFEAVSAVTTTGLSTLATVENRPETFLFARAWLQWVGGLGIVVLSVAILLPQGRAALRLFSGSWQKDDLVVSTRAYARLMLKVYAALTGLGVLVLLFAGMGWFDALTHVLSAVSTGGFSIHDQSLAGLDGWGGRGAVIAFCCLGAMPLGLYYQAVHGAPGRLLKNAEVISLLCFCLAGSVAVSLVLARIEGFGLREAFLHGSLLAFSAQTTAGFSSLDIAGLSNGSKLVMILLMAVGGNVGSTAGGLKIMRILVIVKMIRYRIIQCGLAGGTVIQPRYQGKRLEQEEIDGCFLLAALFSAVVLFSWLPFVIMGYPAMDSLFEVVSACGTVGLSAGITSGTLPPLLKSVLCLDMLMGRLEIIAILVLFYPPTWRGKRRG